MLKFISIFCLLNFLFVTSSFAAAPEVIGDYGDWSAYSYKDSGGLVCYMASSPVKDEGKYSQRGSIYMVVTHRPSDKSFDVVNINAGYNYKQGSKVEVKIGKTTIDKLFTEGDKAWAINDKIDKELVDAMKKGDKMIVHGVSGKGTATKDTYSLKGFTAAYQAISSKCGKK